MPWCPEWSFCNISVHMDCGMTMCTPWSNNPFWIDSSVEHALNCLTGPCSLLGQPSYKTETIICNKSSSCACCNCCKHLSATGKLFKMRFTYLANFHQFYRSALMKTKMKICNDKFFTWYPSNGELKSIIRTCWIQIGRSSKFLEVKSGNRGLWFVSSWKFMPSKYSAKWSHAQVWARASFSICEYYCYVGVRDLKMNDTCYHPPLGYFCVSTLPKHNLRHPLIPLCWLKDCEELILWVNWPIVLFTQMLFIDLDPRSKDSWQNSNLTMVLSLWTSLEQTYSSDLTFQCKVSPL